MALYGTALHLLFSHSCSSIAPHIQLLLIVVKKWRGTLPSSVKPTEPLLLEWRLKWCNSPRINMKVPRTLSLNAMFPAGTRTISPAVGKGNADPGKPKKFTNPSALNVRTLLVPRSEKLVFEILRARLINIACLLETRIPDEGHTILSAHNPEA